MHPQTIFLEFLFLISIQVLSKRSVWAFKSSRSDESKSLLTYNAVPPFDELVGVLESLYPSISMFEVKELSLFSEVSVIAIMSVADAAPLNNVSKLSNFDLDPRPFTCELSHVNCVQL